MFNLKPDEKRGIILGSLAWERYVPSTKHVHDYGSRLASSRNEKARAEGKRKRNRQIYCGSYRLKGNAVCALATAEKLNERISSADIIHHIERGEIAHTDLIISLKPGSSSVDGTMTEIVDRLWYACSGPLKHICDYDRDVEPHPSSYLDTPPGGPYLDTRSNLSRLWSLVRFYIYSCVWHSFCQNATK